MIVSIKSGIHIQLIQYDQFDPGKHFLLCLQGHFLLKQRDVAIMDSFMKKTFTVVNDLNNINHICSIIVNHTFSVISEFELFTHSVNGNIQVRDNPGPK